MTRITGSSIFAAFLTMSTSAAVQTTLYVSPSGSGPAFSEAQPGSLVAARDKVRTMSSAMTGDIVITLRGGAYELTSPLVLTAADGGANGHQVIYQAFPGEKPVLSGGRTITGWSRADSARTIYKATAGLSIDTRQLYVNGVRAIRARSANASGWTESGDGYTCPAAVASWANITRVEVVSRKEWKCHRGPVSSVSGTHAVMAQPYWDDLHKQYDAPPAWVENAYELLDSEGEWYMDRSNGQLFYKPRAGEAMTSAVVVMPATDTLVRGSAVNNLTFRGITFSYAAWVRPNSTGGYPCLQADMPQGAGGQMPGNVAFDHCTNLRFEDNTFEHLGADGLQLFSGCKSCVVYNNIFRDISGTAVSIGSLSARNPSASDLVKDNTVDNNLIARVAVEYEGCVAILVGYTEHTILTHNEIRDLPYSGISMGWGWSNSLTVAKNNEISYNRIDSILRVLRDGGGIYTLSAQPGTQVHHNYISNLFNEFGALYPDEGSSSMNWHQNVVSNNLRWLHMWTGTIQYDTIENNYYDNQTQNTNGTNCVLRNNTYVTNGNWPAEALSIMQTAGRVAPQASIRAPISLTDRHGLVRSASGSPESFDFFSLQGRLIGRFSTAPATEKHPPTSAAGGLCLKQSRGSAGNRAGSVCIRMLR